MPGSRSAMTVHAHKGAAPVALPTPPQTPWIVSLCLPPRASVEFCSQHWGPSSRSQQECSCAELVSQVWWPLPQSPSALLFRMTPISVGSSQPANTLHLPWLHDGLGRTGSDRSGLGQRGQDAQHVPGESNAGKSPGSAFAPCPQAPQAACWREQLHALFRLQCTHLSCIHCCEAAGFALY